MSIYRGKVDTMGLHFISEMAASLSHEMKNALAVINENAGLLGDLVKLAEKGRPLDLGRVQTISDNVLRRVQHADDLVRRLNKLAHSTKQPVVPVDIHAIFEHTIALTTRLAAMKGITFVVMPGEAIQIQTIPFFLENLLWICLKNLLQLTTTEEQQISFMAATEETDVIVTIQCVAGTPIANLKSMITSEGQPLMLFLRCHVEVDTQQGLLQLRMSKLFIE